MPRLEMTDVRRPFLLDFAATWLDESPDFPENVWQDEAAKILEQFGERAAEVQRVLAMLRTHGLFMFDVSPTTSLFDRDNPLRFRDGFAPSRPRREGEAGRKLN